MGFWRGYPQQVSEVAMSQVFSCFTPLHHPKWHFSLSHHPLILTQPRITINQPSSNKQQGGSFPDHHLHAPDSADLSRLGGLPRFRQTSQGAVLGAYLGGVRSLHGGGHGAVDAHGGGLVRRTSGAPWCFFHWKRMVINCWNGRIYGNIFYG